ncbi:Putative ribonuclease H protein At1g65750 [Linum perenne]
MRADSQVTSKGVSRRIDTHIGWRAGPGDCITINTDGSVLQPYSRAAVGGILRTFLGRPVGFFAANPGRCSIMRAELRAAEFGLRIAWDRGFRTVHLQLDSMAAVTAILGDQEVDSRHGRTLEAISELRSRDWEISLSHVYREANCGADYLANIGHSLCIGMHLIQVPDSSLAHWLRYDLIGVSLPTTIPFNN